MAGGSIELLRVIVSLAAAVVWDIVVLAVASSGTRCALLVQTLLLLAPFVAIGVGELVSRRVHTIGDADSAVTYSSLDAATYLGPPI